MSRIYNLETQEKLYEQQRAFHQLPEGLRSKAAHKAIFGMHDRCGPVAERKYIDAQVVDLLRISHFYGLVAMQASRKVNYTMPTASVRVGTFQLEMFYNPYFASQFTRASGASIIRHELEHILRGHVYKDMFKDLDPIFDKEFDDMSESEKLERSMKHQILNIAMDVELNANISNLPKYFTTYSKKGEFENIGKPCTLDTLIESRKYEIKMAKKAIKTAPLDKVAQLAARIAYLEVSISRLKKAGLKQPFPVYYKILIDESNDRKKNGDAQAVDMGMDEHGQVGKNAGTAKEVIKSSVREAYDKMDGRDKGDLPSDLKELIDSILKGKNDWRQMFKKILSSAVSRNIRNTRMRRNRRYGLLNPGKIVKRKKNIWVGIDTSGSVSSECLAMCHAELCKMHSKDLAIWVFNIDAALQEDSVHLFDPNKEFVVHGRGGTSFKPFFDALGDRNWRAKCEKPDAAVMITDGGDGGEMAGNFPSLCGARLFWVLYDNDQIDPDYERYGAVVRIPVNQAA